jgi:RNA polymerase II subunit A-like phosphatase
LRPDDEEEPLVFKVLSNILLGEHQHGWGKWSSVKRKRGAAESDSEDGDDEDDEMPGTKFRRGEALPSDIEFGDDDSCGSDDPPDEIDDGEWNMMGAALEREFLSGSDD